MSAIVMHVPCSSHCSTVGTLQGLDDVAALGPFSTDVLDAWDPLALQQFGMRMQ